MGFRLTPNFVLLALCSLAQFTDLSYGAPVKEQDYGKDACSALVKYADEKALKIPAKEAYDCLLSPPFNHTRSENVYRQVRKFANILSSQAFFNKPDGLPLIVDRVDLNGTFDAIKKKLDSKAYENDYSFNRDITELFGGYHDGHTSYYTNCQGVFGSFMHDYPLVSIVAPGEDTPRIYLADPSTGEVGEEIVEIAGDKALDHMLKLVKVLKGPFDAGWIDADTRWNGLFVGRDALGASLGNFASRDMYPGTDFKMKTHSGKVIDVKWYVSGPGSWNSPDYWKVLFASTSSLMDKYCLVTPGSTESETPPVDEPTEDEPTEDEPTEDEPTEDEPTEDEPTEDEPTEDEPTEDEPTEDEPTEDEPTEDEPTEDEPTEDEPTEDEELTEDDDTYNNEEPTDDDTYNNEEPTDDDDDDDDTYNKPKKHASSGHHRPKLSSGQHTKEHKGSKGHGYPDFSYLDFINNEHKRLRARQFQDSETDWHKFLKARDGNTIEDFSSLELTDMPPVAYPEVATRLLGTEQSLHFMKAYPDVAVWGFHAFASRESQPPNNVLFFYYWRSYMIENLKLLKEKGVKRLILDMSNNGGGSVVLGMETVRRFFPEAEPFYGVDYRRTPLVDAILDLWNGSAGLNQLDGTPFKSVDDFLNPPVAKRGDYFTKIGRFNQLQSSQQEIPDVQFTTKGKPPFAIENLVILTDGQCGSTCAITVEALSSLGIATVVTGGQPTKEKQKSMQYIGGIKGYQVLSFEEVLSDPAETGPGWEEYAVYPVDIQFSSRMNLRNSYTPDDHMIPQEFIFQPADAHLWYTKQMINDRTILWNDVVKLTWDENGKNKLLQSHSDSQKHTTSTAGKHGLGLKAGTKHPKQPKAGYHGQRNREALREGVLADFKYLSEGWITGWSGK